MPDTNRKPLSLNQQRIMDVLLEDACKPAIVAAPAPQARRHAPRPRRRIWTGAAVTVACLVVVAIAVGYALTRPPIAPPSNTPFVASNAPMITPRPQPRPQPMPGNDAQPQPLPDRPEPLPEVPPAPTPQPQPEPAPETPPEQVENPPQPQPEPAPLPTPERPDTAPGPAVLVAVVGKVVGLDRNAKLRLRYREQEWRDYDAAKPEDLLDGVQLVCRKPVDIQAGGALLRLQGELNIRAGKEASVLALADGDLYVDNESGPALALSVSGHELALASCAALIERGSSDTDVSVFHGEVAIAEEKIAAGKRGVLKKRGLSGLYDLARKPAEFDLLKTLPARILYREDFDSEKPEGRLRAGKINGGSLRSEFSEGKHHLFWGYPRDVACLEGMTIRLRVKFSNAQAATFSQFCPQRNDNFSRELGKPGDGWQIIEINAADLRERTTFKEAPGAGEYFQNFSLLLTGQDPVAEVDWVEIVRSVK